MLGSMRKRVIWVGVLLASLGLVGVILLLARNPTSRTVTLANGITLEYLGATYGTNHVAPGFSRLGRLLPRPLQSLFGLSRPSQFFRTETLSLAVWLRDDPLSAGNRVGRISVVSLLADERGVVAGDDDWQSFQPGAIGGGGTLNLQFRTVPGRSRMITVKFFDEGGGSDRVFLGELVFPNPAFTRAPVWEAESLPASRTNGNLVCRLERVVAGVSHRTIQRNRGEVEFAALKPGEGPYGLGLFRFAEDGLPSTNWSVGTVWLADATGNSLHCGSSMHRYEEDLVAHRFGPILWPDEVWDLAVWAKRKPTAPFTEDEVIVLEGIQVPALGDTNRLESVFPRQGIEVRVEQFVHRAPPEPGGYSMDDLTHLRVELSKLPDGMYFDLVELVDEEGRELRGSGWSRTHGEPSVSTFAFQDVPEGAKTLRARMVVHRGRRFDFRVQPEGGGTNGFRMRTGQ